MFLFSEADEYDRSFLQLSPDVALISAMDADHLDIYGTKENMVHSFVQFSERLRAGGLLLTNYNLSVDKLSAANHIRYSLRNNHADIFSGNIEFTNGGYQFDVVTKSWQLNNVQLNMGGLHNIENAIAAISIAHHLKIDPEKIKDAVNDFKGVKRRFEYIISPTSKTGQANDKVIFIDDYAHHPQELNALISGAKSLFPGKRCTVIFQPHLFSRTKDLADEFAESLDQADEIVLLPIYPARELPIEGVTSNLIKDKMKNKNVKVLSKDDLIQFLKDDYSKLIQKVSADNVLITAGAGDIDQLVNPIKEILLNNIL
jgi:UDP-N-acetylmuramate--alanine ligase